ncbi:MAG: TerB N-terminal domain-containing protein [Candidatus Omnitrophica bacterium]|nr:TerB N-terminal domain-containing protein [Candidatus Omnitrophota bacterium]
MGYVFLYFYGLERRFFVDKSIFEWPVIMNEVERLKRIFSSNGSFRHLINVNYYFPLTTIISPETRTKKLPPFLSLPVFSCQHTVARYV